MVATASCPPSPCRAPGPGRGHGCSTRQDRQRARRHDPSAPGVAYRGWPLEHNPSASL